MLRRSVVGVLMLALIWTVSVNAQVKTVKPTQPKSAMTLDINSAPESEIVALGIEKAAAKKIVEMRPFRNKRELVSKQLITADQYDKLKDKIVARQPKKG